MTREEAKHIVDVAFGVPQAVRRSGEDRTYHEDEIREAKEMAIQALSQEPCEDAISRQAVLDGIEELKKSPWATDKRGIGFEYLITEALEVVADLCVKREPPVTLKQKMGRWIAVEDEDMNTTGYFCSECDLPLETEERTLFCPNCGAKMVKQQESEE